jgi:L-malate glycosyltransferase
MKQDALRIAILCHASAGGSGVVATELAIALAELGCTVHLVAPTRPFRLTSTREAMVQDSSLEPNANESVVKQVNVFQRLMQNLLNRFKNAVPELPSITEDPSATEDTKTRGSVQFHPIATVDYPLFDSGLTALTAANTLKQISDQYGLDIVHAHYAVPFGTSAVLARDISGGAFQVVTTLHGTDVTLIGSDPALRGTTGDALHRADAVTAVSRDLAEDARSAFQLGLPNVIYNWVDATRFRPIRDAKLREQYVHIDEKLIMHVSNFREVKRPQDVIRIFAGISAAMPARLVMVGDGPERTACVELAKELNVHGRILFLEFTPEIENILGLADLFLLPSELESFGLAALEAMACGAPVVASRAGGIPEVVVQGETGFLCPIGDTQDMVSASLDILRNPELHEIMSKNARVRATQHFNPELIVPQYLELYRSILECNDATGFPSPRALGAPDTNQSLKHSTD